MLICVNTVFIWVTTRYFYRSGCEEPYSEKDTLLQEIISMEADLVIKKGIKP